MLFQRYILCTLLSFKPVVCQNIIKADWPVIVLKSVLKFLKYEAEKLFAK